MSENYYVYFLHSKVDRQFYIGCTSKNPVNRLFEHNSGKVTSTKRRRPFTLEYFEKFDDKHDAFKREWHLKHPAGYQEKLSIIRSIIFDKMGQ